VSASDQRVLSQFQPERQRLIGLAYRMLGSYAEAEDVVQDAFVRFHAVDLDSVLDPRSYLSTTVARLCFDRMKSARARHESYVGTWLPEPIVDPEPQGPDTQLQLADDLSFALLMTLEKLSPPERTAFLLHDVFGMEFENVASVLDRSSAACRKLAERAREQVQAGRTRFRSEPEEEMRLFQAFSIASATGDLDALTKLLAEDAIMYQDGGGKRHAALNPIYGRDKIIRFTLRVQHKDNYKRPIALIPCRVNQLQGCVMQYADGDLAVGAFEVKDGVITRIYIVNNPDKVRHLRPHVET
jgi:RNA polymerase sigma-70 factor (ECF subfamily)